MNKNKNNKSISSIKPKKSAVSFSSPMTGKAVSLASLKDGMFSKKMLGDGFAIEPSKGAVYSPVNGTILVASPETKHAYGIVDTNGNEFLIHIGFNTVELKGDGFTSHVVEGQTVSQGQLIAEVDLRRMKQLEVKATTTIITTKGKAITSAVGSINKFDKVSISKK